MYLDSTFDLKTCLKKTIALVEIDINVLFKVHIMHTYSNYNRKIHSKRIINIK